MNTVINLRQKMQKTSNHKNIWMMKNFNIRVWLRTLVKELTIKSFIENYIGNTLKIIVGCINNIF